MLSFECRLWLGFLQDGNHWSTPFNGLFHLLNDTTVLHPLQFFFHFVQHCRVSDRNRESVAHGYEAKSLVCEPCEVRTYELIRCLLTDYWVINILCDIDWELSVGQEKINEGNRGMEMAC